VEFEIERRQLRDTVLCIGSRSDIPHLFTSMFDVFALPSLFEGLGLVLIEAQAAGCPSVISDVVPTEADVVPGLVVRLPLEAAAEQWADALSAEAAAARSRQHRKAALRTVSESPFDIDHCIRALTDLYSRAIPQSESRLQAV
jgi:glycosyltransferase involved in cell wall biosynthesis